MVYCPLDRCGSAGPRGWSPRVDSGEPAVTFATDMQTSAIADSRSSRAVWAEVQVKERRAAAHTSSRALGLPEAVPVEMAVDGALRFSGSRPAL